MTKSKTLDTSKNSDNCVVHMSMITSTAMVKSDVVLWRTEQSHKSEGFYDLLNRVKMCTNVDYAQKLITKVSAVAKSV
jgi:hypothetical protein